MDNKELPDDIEEAEKIRTRLVDEVRILDTQLTVGSKFGSIRENLVIRRIKKETELRHVNEHIKNLKTNNRLIVVKIKLDPEDLRLFLSTPIRSEHVVSKEISDLEIPEIVEDVIKLRESMGQRMREIISEIIQLGVQINQDNLPPEKRRSAIQKIADLVTEREVCHTRIDRLKKYLTNTPKKEYLRVHYLTEVEVVQTP